MAANDPLGVDLDCISDLDPFFRLCYGTKNLGNALLRRVQSDPGCLATINDDPDYGYNLNNEVMTESDSPTDMAAINAKIMEQLHLDERVQEAQSRVISVEEND